MGQVPRGQVLAGRAPDAAAAQGEGGGRSDEAGGVPGEAEQCGVNRLVRYLCSRLGSSFALFTCLLDDYVISKFVV